MSKRVLNPDSLPAPRGFNHAIEVDAGRLLFLAGQDAANEDGEIVSDELPLQFKQVLANLQTVLKSAGGEMTDIVKLTIYVDDRDAYEQHLDRLGPIFDEYFGGYYPAMALFEVNGFFRQNNRIEMEGIAVRDSE